MRTTLEQSKIVIDGLGGTKKASGYFGVSAISICNWRKLGIPLAKMHELYGRDAASRKRIAKILAMPSDLA